MKSLDQRYLQIIVIPGMLLSSLPLAAANWLLNPSFETPSLASGQELVNATINGGGAMVEPPYAWRWEGGGDVTLLQADRLPLGKLPDGANCLLLYGQGLGVAQTRRGIAGSQATRSTHYTLTVDIFYGSADGTRGVYGGNEIIVAYSGGKLGQDGRDFIYLSSRNQDDGLGTVPLTVDNDKQQLVRHARNESVTGTAPQTNFGDAPVRGQWHTVKLSWEIKPTTLLMGCDLTVYLRRPTGTWVSQNNWTAFDLVRLQIEPAAAPRTDEGNSN